MNLHYAGKYNGKEASLPQREHPKGAVAFKEPKNMNILSLTLNIASGLLLLLLCFLCFLRSGFRFFNIWGGLVAVVCCIPHEFLHALCFRGEVFLYQNLRQGLLFVIGTEDLSKTRFILMSFCPNIIFGFLPFLVYMIFPSLSFFGTLGAFSIAMGVGDYLNIINALVQMPKGAVTYLCGMHSYWYLPSEQ